MRNGVLFTLVCEDCTDACCHLLLCPSFSTWKNGSAEVSEPLVQASFLYKWYAYPSFCLRVTSRVYECVIFYSKESFGRRTSWYSLFSLFDLLCNLCLSVCVRVCMDACMHIWMNACMHVCMYLWMHACMRVCLSVCLYVCIYESSPSYPAF